MLLVVKCLYDTFSEFTTSDGGRFSDGNSWIFNNMRTDITVTAHFTAENQTLTLAVNPAGGGTITGQTSGDEIVVGTPVALTANPTNGYALDSWTFSPDLDSTHNGNDVTFNMPETAITITANFTEIPTYALNLKVDPTEGGIIKDAVGNVVTPGSLKYTAGSQMDFTAEPKSGYKFKQWAGDYEKWMGNYVSGSEGNIIQFFMPDYGMELIAIFEKEEAPTTQIKTDKTIAMTAVKTSDDLNICPYLTTLVLTEMFYLLLKTSFKKPQKNNF